MLLQKNHLDKGFLASFQGDFCVKSLILGFSQCAT